MSRPGPDCSGRQQFLASAATAMRRILIATSTALNSLLLNGPRKCSSWTTSCPDGREVPAEGEARGIGLLRRPDDCRGRRSTGSLPSDGLPRLRILKGRGCTGNPRRARGVRDKTYERVSTPVALARHSPRKTMMHSCPGLRQCGWTTSDGCRNDRGSPFQRRPGTSWLSASTRKGLTVSGPRNSRRRLGTA